jgi:4-hydroxy-3-methylbut-2-en-1-yl diphosphate reductase
MARLLICAPLGIEARALRRGLPAGPPEVTVVRTGFGAARCALPIRGHDAVAVAGFGGALDGALRPGDVLVATEVWYGRRRLPCAAAEPLVRELAGVGVHAEYGPLITVDHLVREAERRRLARTGARAVDMEAGPLLVAAAGLPATVVRAIVDTPGRPLLSPAGVIGGLAARRTLRRIGPALVRWARAAETTPRGAPSEEGGHP